MKAATIRDVAVLAGVSPVTVSRFLNEPQRVRKETRERIQNAASKLGFVPDQRAGTLSGAKSRAVGVVLPTLANHGFSQFLQSLSEALSLEGFQLIVASRELSKEREEDIVRQLCGWRPAGLILLAYRHTKATMRMVSDLDIPTVESMEFYDPPLDMCVGFSNAEAARDMTVYLIGRGRRSIAYISMPSANYVRAKIRCDGYRQAMAQHGLPELIVEAENSLDGGGKAIRQLLRQQPDLEAVFCATDLLALGVLNECRRQRIPVPDRLALAGFNGSDLATLSAPRITTMRTPTREAGAAAARMVIERYMGTGPATRALKLPHEILVGETT